MSLEQRYYQSTTVTIAPQLHQAIKLLQLSHQELEIFLTEQMTDNPFLVWEEELEHAKDRQLAFDTPYITPFNK